jgi:hypothetical protein
MRTHQQAPAHPVRTAFGPFFKMRTSGLFCAIVSHATWLCGMRGCSCGTACQSHLDRIICPRRPAASPGVWLRAGLLRRNAVIVPHKPAQSRVRGRVLVTERLVDSMQATRRVPVRATRVHGCLRAERRSLRDFLCPARPLAPCADSVTGRLMGRRCACGRMFRQTGSPGHVAVHPGLLPHAVSSRCPSRRPRSYPEEFIPPGAFARQCTKDAIRTRTKLDPSRHPHE